MLPTAALMAALACHPVPDSHPHCAVRRVKVVTAPEVFAEQLARYGFDSLDVGRPADALVMFDASLRLMWGVPFHHWGRATTLAALGRHDDAADAYTRMFDHGPTDVEVWQLVAIGWVERGKLAEAEVCFAHAIEVAGSERARFECYLRESASWAGARPRQKWPKVIRGGTRKAAAAHSQLAVTDPSRLVRAELSASRALALDGGGEFNSRADVHINRGTIRYHLGRIRDAVGDVEQALALAPTNAEAHYARAYMARDQRDTATALAHLELAARYGAPPAHVAQVRCGVLADAGESAKAEQAAREWYRLDPKSVDALRMHGALLRLLGQDDEADRVAERAAELTDSSVLGPFLDQVHTLLSLFEHRESAFRTYARLLARPHLTRVQYLEALSRRADLWRFLGQQTEAFDDLTTVVRLVPANPRARLLRLTAAESLHREREVLEDAAALRRLKPGDVETASIWRRVSGPEEMRAAMAGRAPDYRPAGPLVPVPITVSAPRVLVAEYGEGRRGDVR